VNANNPDWRLGIKKRPGSLPPGLENSPLMLNLPRKMITSVSRCERPSMNTRPIIMAARMARGRPDARHARMPQTRRATAPRASDGGRELHTERLGNRTPVGSFRRAGAASCANSAEPSSFPRPSCPCLRTIPPSFSFPLLMKVRRSWCYRNFRLQPGSTEARAKQKPDKFRAAVDNSI